METDNTKQTYLVTRTGCYGMTVVGIIDLTTSQHVEYIKKVERLNRKIDGELPEMMVYILPVERTHTHIIDDLLRAGEEMNRMKVYGTDTESPISKEEFETYLEMLKIVRSNIGSKGCKGT